MTDETGWMLLQSGWIYLGLLLASVVIFVLCWSFGVRARRSINKESVEISSIFITSIFSFFAILVGFQLSGSTRIYETQRKLSVDEILSIAAVADSIDALAVDDRAEVLRFLVKYIEQRERLYAKPLVPLEMERKGRAQKDLVIDLLRHSYGLLPKYQGDQRVAFTVFLNRVESMSSIFDQQRASIFLQTPRILWQALIGLMLIITAICGYKIGIEKGQQFGLTLLFLLVVFAAIFICLSLGSPRASVIPLDSIDQQFPKLLHRIQLLEKMN